MADVRLKVWGDLACFTRPDANVERVSYTVMTPSAASGILRSIFWKPEFSYQIRTIATLHPIRYFSLTRNGVRHKIDPFAAMAWAANSAGGYFSDDPYLGRVQQHSLLLRDVAYIIEADIRIKPHAIAEIAEHAPEFVASYQRDYGRFPDEQAVVHHLLQKYRSQFRRRAENGQSYFTPYLGCREFVAYFSLPDGTEQPIPLTQSLGSMFFGFRCTDEREARKSPVFFEAVLTDGVLHIPPHLYAEGVEH